MERSLTYGYLPHELPFSFTSESFAKAALGLTRVAKPRPMMPVRFSVARAGGIRRPIEIPNPFAQLGLVQLCSAEWRTLQRLTARSTISLSRPVKPRTGRALRYRHQLGERPAIAISRMPGGAVTLQTDVSQFYASIYTHAVDWAVRGKTRAKRHRHAAVLGADLDARLREARDGQTAGISIGPETSWLVSEVLMARVDEALCTKFPNLERRAFRFVDDMTFYAQSEGEAYDVLGAYQRFLADFELLLNPRKVNVSTGLEPPLATWASSLRQVRYRHDTDTHLAQDIVDLFAFALEARNRFPTDGVLSYAIKRCDPFPGGESSWPVYRDAVLAAVTQEPSTLRYVYEVLVFARTHGLEVNTDRLVEVFNQLCVTHAQLDHGFEVSWILSILRELRLPLDSTAGKAVAAMEDNCSLILLRDMLESSPRLSLLVDMNAAVSRAETKGALSTSDWLLAYEFRAARWCRPAVWDHSLQWKEMNKAGVRFLVPSAVKRKRLRRKRPAFLTGWGYS